MRVAVIGAGVVGVNTAYFSALQGHQVTVIEQRGNVAEEASRGHAGLLGTAHVRPMAAQGMPHRLVAQLLQVKKTAQWRPSTNLAQWRWLRRWMSECQLNQQIKNTEKMQRLSMYGQQLLDSLGQRHSIDFQQRNGILELFRTAKDIDNLTPCLELLSQSGLSFQQLDAAACYALEPALAQNPALHGGLYFDQDGSGNCALFTKQVKSIAQQLDVKFDFLQRCDEIIPQSNGFTLHLVNSDYSSPMQQQRTQHHFDAVVLAAGADSNRFLKKLGIATALASFQSYCCTAMIKNPEATPELSIIDETFQVAITRMDKRIRIAGTSQLGRRHPRIDERAWQTLRHSATEWFPNAANYHSANVWNSSHLMMPDGAPVIGKTPVKHLYVNLAHAEQGWSMATGAGKLVADLLSNNVPDIDIEGLTLADRL